MKRLSLLLLGAGLLLSCRKEDILIIATDQAGSLTELRRQNGPVVQTFTFNLNEAQVLRTTGKATLRFPANAFRLPNGALATGQAQLRVKEVYNVAGMVLADMPTTTAWGQLLQSGGEFSIQAWQGSTRLRMAASAQASSAMLTLESPVPAGLDTARTMTLWQQASSPGPASSNDSIGWVPVGTSPVPIIPASPVNFYRAMIPLDSISWWNIDQLLAPGPGTLVYVEVPQAAETKVYLRPVGVNGLARLYAPPGSLRWSGYMPLGFPMVAVVLQSRNDRLFFGTQALTVQANMVVQPQLEELPEAEILRRIRLL
ncbi:hypothetical protein GCM10023185_34780 [Hymenobacter saemangeumensis]|uniref:DUF4380 domain-containing protein n=1 Tax=Hymenobacter saemangeumensis TaxID=1084522 RepID=A0ABP8IPL6_9BACT